MSVFPATGIDPKYTIDGTTQYMDDSGIEGDTVVNELSTRIFNLETKVGIDSSAVTTTFDYKLSEVLTTDKAVGKSATQTLTNKTLTSPTITTPIITVKDTQFSLQDDGDTTKQLQFQLSGITTSTTRTLTVPDISDTLVTLTATQTLTNKTLTSPAINTPTIVGGTISSATVSTSTALDTNANPNFTYSGIARQAIINGNCIVAQRVTAPSATTAYQYGSVDRIAGKATGTLVSAGTVAQTSSANAGSTSYAFKMAGMTITGTGIVYARYRMEAKDAVNFKNLVTSFSCSVYHDTGSAINYTIFIRKATVADNFAATTDIANSGAISVPNTTKTTITYNNINSGNIGDVTNGIEIEIQAACGAVTTKNFEFADWQFNKGSFALAFQPKSFADEYTNSRRYYRKSFVYATAPAQNAGRAGDSLINVVLAGANGVSSQVALVPQMRVSPNNAGTVTFYNPSAANAQARDISAGADCTGTAIITSGISSNENMLGVTFTTPVGTVAGDTIEFHYSIDAEL